MLNPPCRNVILWSKVIYNYDHKMQHRALGNHSVNLGSSECSNPSTERECFSIRSHIIAVFEMAETPLHLSFY